LVGEFLLVLIEPLGQCALGQLDDLFEIAERLGRDLQVGGLIEIGLSRLIGSLGRGKGEGSQRNDEQSEAVHKSLHWHDRRASKPCAPRNAHYVGFWPRVLWRLEVGRAGG